MSAELPESPSVPITRRRVTALFRAQMSRIESESDTIRQYLDNVISGFAQEYRRHEMAMQEIDDDVPGHIAEGIAEEFQQAKVNYRVRFPQFALEMTFLSVYSFLEDEMMNVCQFVRGRLGIVLKPNKLSDKGIDAAKTYLEDVCGIRVSDHRTWQRVRGYRTIRNCFAHARGRVNADNQDIRACVAINQGKLELDNGRLIISQEYCYAILEDAESLLKYLVSSAGERVGLC